LGWGGGGADLLLLLDVNIRGSFGSGGISDGGSLPPA